MSVKSLHRILGGALFFAMAFTMGFAAPARAAENDPMHARLSADRIGDIMPGEYSAGDDLAFTLTGENENFLLHFSNAPEIFVLHAERASLGGRVLKYDYGAIALKVSAWGGMTLYTQNAPGGLPATRIGDSAAPGPLAVSQDELQNALKDESSHLLYARQLRIMFAAHAPRLQSDSGARLLAFAALINAGAALEDFAATDMGRRSLGKKIGNIEILTGDRPAIQRTGGTLLVHFASDQGYAGLASSQMIVHSLEKLLGSP